MNNQQTTLFNQIDLAYNDPEVQQHKVLTDLLINAAQHLQHGTGSKMVSVRLSRDIAHYATGHPTTTPKALINLYHQISVEASKFAGEAIASFFL